jgi:hypothetical protein
MSYLIKNITCNFLVHNAKQITASLFHTSSVLDQKWNKHNTGPTRWLEYNKKIYPPQMLPKEEEQPRPAVHI